MNKKSIIPIIAILLFCISIIPVHAALSTSVQYNFDLSSNYTDTITSIVMNRTGVNITSPGALQSLTNGSVYFPNGNFGYNLNMYAGLLNTTNSTINMWVNITGAEQYDNILHLPGVTTQLGFDQLLGGCTLGAGKLCIGDTGSGAVETSYNAYFNKSTMITVVYNTTDLSVYINGVYAMGKAKVTSGNITQYYFGNQQSQSRSMNGRIGPITLWNRTLDSSELLLLYNNSYGILYPFVFNNSNLNINVKNLVNNSVINNFCINATGDNTTQNICTTNGTISFNTTGLYNITAYNIQGGSYYNVSYQNYNFSATTTLTLSSYQNLLNVAVKQLYTNNSILSFNTTNNLQFNSTTTGSLLIPANNGSNNLLINVSGNYSINATCNITIPTTTVNCIIGGIYDNVFNITAKNSTGSTINNFTVYYTNNSVVNNGNCTTTNGTCYIPLLQGYYYNFSINDVGSSIGTAVLPANASTNKYQFQLLTLNTFELAFYNETSSVRYNSSTNLVYISLISNGTFANNYTLNTSSNTSIIIPLLVPQAYTISYFIDPQLPRNYYLTLTPQSYNNISLFILDTNISTIYLPFVYNENLQPLQGAVIQLLRYYIDSSTQTGSYKIVEMTTADTNGQGVLRVVPNVIAYKLVITNGNNSIITNPTKFTSSSNGYTLSSNANVLNNVLALKNFKYELTYINSTTTFSYTFNDPSLLVSNTCLTIQKIDNKVGTNSIVSSNCTNTITPSGSIIYTITDTNNTIYTATAQAFVGSTVSTLDVETVNFTNTSLTFGIVGIIIVMMVLLTIGISANETGLDGLVVASILGITFFGTIGIITWDYTAWIGVIIFGIVLMFKTRK